MNGTRRMQIFFALAACSLATACAPVSQLATAEGLLDIDDLKTYRVEDARGVLSLVVKDVLVDDHTGEIDYLMVESEPSGYGLDPHTAPVVAGEYVLIPWKAVRVDSGNGRLLLTVNEDVVLHAPRSDQLSWPMSRGAWAEVDQYWKSALGGG